MKRIRYIAHLFVIVLLPWIVSPHSPMHVESEDDFAISLIRAKHERRTLGDVAISRCFVYGWTSKRRKTTLLLFS